MANVPGIKPNPLPQPEHEHHDHLLPDEQWGQVVRDAKKFRAESDEPEAD